jgi:hypothetical protein
MSQTANLFRQVSLTTQWRLVKQFVSSSTTSA